LAISRHFHPTDNFILSHVISYHVGADQERCNFGGEAVVVSKEETDVWI